MLKNERYLTTKELSALIKYRKQTIYNLVHDGTFVLGKHYLKPTAKKLFLKWSEIKAWLGENIETSDIYLSDTTFDPSREQNENFASRQVVSRIVNGSKKYECHRIKI